jgi:hypothetical protein
MCLSSSQLEARLGDSHRKASEMTSKSNENVLSLPQTKSLIADEVEKPVATSVHLLQKQIELQNTEIIRLEALAFENELQKQIEFQNAEINRLQALAFENESSQNRFSNFDTDIEEDWDTAATVDDPFDDAILSPSTKFGYQDLNLSEDIDMNSNLSPTIKDTVQTLPFDDATPSPSTFGSQDLNLSEDVDVNSNLSPNINDQTPVPTQGISSTLPPTSSTSSVLDEPEQDLQIDNELMPGSSTLTPFGNESNDTDIVEEVSDEEVSSPNVPLPSLSNWRQTKTVDSGPISAQRTDTSRSSSLRSNLPKTGRTWSSF